MEPELGLDRADHLAEGRRGDRLAELHDELSGRAAAEIPAERRAGRLVDVAGVDGVGVGEGGEVRSGVELAAEREDVLVTRTFSKIHGLAGLRLGWAYGHESLIDTLNRVRGPFNVSAPAIAAGVAAVKDKEFVARSAAHNARWLAWLQQQLGGLGLNVTPSVCNFVLIHFPETPGKTAEDADAYLTSRGLILREVRPYGLANALRMSIGLEEHNRAVVDALKAFLAE